MVAVFEVEWEELGGFLGCEAGLLCDIVFLCLAELLSGHAPAVFVLLCVDIWEDGEQEYGEGYDCLFHFLGCFYSSVMYW